MPLHPWNARQPGTYCTSDRHRPNEQQQGVQGKTSPFCICRVQCQQVPVSHSRCQFTAVYRPTRTENPARRPANVCMPDSQIPDSQKDRKTGPEPDVDGEGIGNNRRRLFSVPVYLTVPYLTLDGQPRTCSPAWAVQLPSPAYPSPATASKSSPSHT